MTIPSILRHVRKEAHKCEMRHRLGAVVIKNGKIISTGHNQKRYVKSLKKTWRSRKDSVCAERMALLKCLDKARGAVLYVGRVNNENDFLLAKPCETCMRMIKDLGIKRVFYTDYNGKLREV